MIFNKEINVLHFDNGNKNNYPHYIKSVIVSESKKYLKNILTNFNNNYLLYHRIKRKSIIKWELVVILKIENIYSEDDYCKMYTKLSYLCGENMSNIITFGLDFRNENEILSDD